MPKRRRTAPRSRTAGGPPAPAAPPPPTLRDPWAWAATLAVLPLILHSLGAPLGEPVADDFYFLHHTLFSKATIFDGGGFTHYWRPLSRQGYFGLFTPALLEHPGVVAAFHATALALAVLLLYRALRRRWRGPWAASAASFPALVESTRMLIAWPSNFQDLGAVLFAALALHEAAFRRLPTTLLALLASLLCKEVAVVAAFLVPWMPGPGPTPSRARLRWAVATAALIAAWALTYIVVYRHAGLLLPRQTQADPTVLTTPWALRVLWALGKSVRDAFGLPGAAPWDGACAVALLTLAGAALVAFWASAAARARLGRALPWIAWGLAWFLGAIIPLADVYPNWAPYRSTLGTLGVGVTSTALLGASHPALLAGLLVVRLGAFAASPGPPRSITLRPDETGFVFDFGKLTRLQRMIRETREVLRDRYPRLPHGARVGRHFMPRLAFYAFEGDLSLQVWYRDTTLSWIAYGDLGDELAESTAAVVEYQSHRQPQIVLVEPEALRHLIRAAREFARGEYEQVMRDLDRADSLQADRNAAVFLSMSAGRRALTLRAMGRRDEAIREAQRSLELWREDNDARFVLGQEWWRRGRLAEAEAQFDTLLRLYPSDSNVRTIWRTIRAARGRAGR